MYKYQVIICAIFLSKISQGIVIWSNRDVSLTGQWDQIFQNFISSAEDKGLQQGVLGIQETERVKMALLPGAIRDTQSQVALACTL